MSGVVNGQFADENTFNNAFMARNGDTDTVGKVDLLNPDGVSGASISNIQRAINSLCSSLGITNAEAQDYLISWASAIVGSSPSSAKDKVDALTLAFRGGAGLGHNHDGTDGQGEKISANDLLDFNQLFVSWLKIGSQVATGGSHDVTAELVGKSPGGSPSAAGVLTDPPLNRVELINVADQTYFEDDDGRKIYGRLTESSGNWTVTFYKVVAGVETGHSFSGSVTFQALYREVFDQENRPTISENPFEFGTVDVTADVVDASATRRGVVSTGAQAFGGAKTFNDDLEILSALFGSIQTDAATTGSNATTAAPTKLILKVTNASLASISLIPKPSKSQVLILRNYTTNQITINDSADIKTGTGANLDLENEASLVLAFDVALDHWFVVGGSGASGGFVSPLTTKGDIHVFSTSDTRLPVGSNGQALVADSSQSTGLSWSSVMNNPMTTAGDIVYGGSGGTPTRLAAGTTGRALVAGSTPSYFDAGSGRVVFGGTSGELASNSGLVFSDTAGVRSLSVTSGSNDAIWLTDATDTYFGPVSAHNLRLRTNSLTRMMIDSSGDSGLGTSPVSGRLLALQRSPGAATMPIMVMDIASNTTSDQYIIQFTRSTYSVELGKINRNGTGDAVAYSTTSDQRLKEDFKEFDGLSLIKKAKVYDFKWKSSNQRNYGFKAQELHGAIPSVVFSGDLDPDNPAKTWSVDLPGLVPVLVRSIQELSEKVDSLAQRVIELESGGSN